MIAKFKSKEEIIKSLEKHGYTLQDTGEYRNKNDLSFGSLGRIPFLKQVEVLMKFNSCKETSGYFLEEWYETVSNFYPKDFFVDLKEKFDTLLEKEDG